VRDKKLEAKIGEDKTYVEVK